MSNGPFQRGLDDGFVKDLLEGVSAPILSACRDAGLDVRIRERQLTAYSAGRAVATLRSTTRGIRFEVHQKYVQGFVLTHHNPAPGGEGLVVQVTPSFASGFRHLLAHIVQTSAAFVKEEEQCEALFLRHNALGTPFVAVDRQVGVPGTRSFVDVVGVCSHPEPTFVLVELKRDLDNRIQRVPAQVDRYLGIFNPGGSGLRADVANAFQEVSRQLRQLGFIAPSPSLFQPGMPVLGLVVLVRYNPRSTLLHRAHASAGQLAQPVWLWNAPGTCQQE